MPPTFRFYNLDAKFVVTHKEMRVLEIIQEQPNIRTGDLSDILKEEGLAWHRNDREYSNRGAPHKELQKMGLITYETAGRYKQWYTTGIGSKLLRAHPHEFTDWEEAKQLMSNGTVASEDWRAVETLFDILDSNIKNDTMRGKILSRLPTTVSKKLLNRTVVRKT